jgi:hypothetical protein
MTHNELMRELNRILEEIFRDEKEDEPKQEKIK